MNYEQNTKKQGKVWLVGAGPSDQELLTVKGKRLLSEADVIVYDRLAGQGVLTYGAEHAEYIDVGKHSGNHRVGPVSYTHLSALPIWEQDVTQSLHRWRQTAWTVKWKILSYPE